MLQADFAVLTAGRIRFSGFGKSMGIPLFPKTKYPNRTRPKRRPVISKNKDVSKNHRFIPSQ